MEIRILGPLEVRDGDRVLGLGGGKQRALLADLVIHRGEPLTLDRLADDLWGEHAPPSVAKTLRALVSRLRKTLGRDAIVTRGGGYLLADDGITTDVGELERLLRQSRSAQDATAATDALQSALALFRGQPLTEFTYEEFARTEIARLEEIRLSALEERLEGELAQGLYADAVPELESLVAENPLRERLRAQLMLALYRAGRQAEALEAYRAARQTLIDELGIEPGRKLGELQQAILRQDPSLDGVARQRGAPARPARSTFVGRERELAELSAALASAVAGSGRLVLLAGEPGIGKSRLAEELAAQARAGGARILVGRCWEAGGAPAFWPWVQAIRAYVREGEPEALRRELGGGARHIAQIVPEVRHAFDDLAEPPSLETEGARFRLFDATSEFLRNASTKRPIVVVLDDLHAADTPSLLLLQFVARELPSMHVLLVAAFRDIDPLVSGDFGATVTDLTGESSTTLLSLRGLSEQDVDSYLQLAASDIASPQLAAKLHEGTEGNPLFVAETVRLLSLEGSQTDLALTIPQSVRDVIARRLRHLSEECNRLLLLASVLGREFDSAELASIGRLSEDELLDRLDEAMTARVVAEVPGDASHLRFAHVLIRDTLYESLPSGRRIQLHRQVVGALECRPDTNRATLMQHAIGARDFARGLRYGREAADRALDLLAFEEAARLYRHALEMLELADPSNDVEHCELLLSLGQAEMRGGNTAIAQAAFVDAATSARRLGLAPELARAALGYARDDMYLRAGDDFVLIPLLEEALGAVGEGDVDLRAHLLARLAGALRDEPMRDRRDRLSREAVELARSTGSRAALAYALDGRVPAIIAPDSLDECLAVATELCEVAEQNGDRARLAHGHLHVVIVRLMAGEADGIEAGVSAINEIAQELKEPTLLYEVLAGQAAMALASGRLAAADDLAERALALGESTKAEIAIPIHALQRYTLDDLRGDVDDSNRRLSNVVAAHPARAVFRCALAHLHARRGDIPEATRILADLSRDNFAAVPFDQEWLLAASFLGETIALLQDDVAAAALYDLLLPYRALNAADWPEGFRGAISRYLGLLAAMAGELDAAATHFEAALALNDHTGVRPWLARTQHDYARVLSAQGEDKRAEELMTAAEALEQEIGMKPVVFCRT